MVGNLEEVSDRQELSNGKSVAGILGPWLWQERRRRASVVRRQLQNAGKTGLGGAQRGRVPKHRWKGEKTFLAKRGVGS